MGIRYAWRVFLDDDDWDKDVPAQSFSFEEEIPEKRRSQLPAWISTLILAGTIVMGASLYLWQQAQAGLVKIEADLSEAVAVEEISQDRGRASQIPSATISDFDLRDSRALVQLQCVSADQPIPYSETRFYRQSTTGWLPAAPDEAFWGSEGSLGKRILCVHVPPSGSGGCVRDSAFAG